MHSRCRLQTTIFRDYQVQSGGDRRLQQRFRAAGIFRTVDQCAGRQDLLRIVAQLFV
jgi:hypothetical protein